MLLAAICGGLFVERVEYRKPTDWIPKIPFQAPAGQPPPLPGTQTSSGYQGNKKEWGKPLGLPEDCTLCQQNNCGEIFFKKIILRGKIQQNFLITAETNFANFFWVVPPKTFHACQLN